MVLINLASVNLLASLQDLPEHVLVPPRVLEETAGAGERLGYSDALAIRKAVEVGSVRVTKTADARVLRRLQSRARLRETDAEVVAIALRERAILGSDDAKVRRVAELEGLTCGGTGYLLGRLIAEGILTKEQARTHLDTLIAEGWHCDVSTYAGILRRLGF